MSVSITYRQQDESDSLAGRLNDDLYRLTMDFPTLFGGEKGIDICRGLREYRGARLLLCRG